MGLSLSTTTHIISPYVVPPNSSSADQRGGEMMATLKLLHISRVTAFPSPPSLTDWTNPIDYFFTYHWSHRRSWLWTFSASQCFSLNTIRRRGGRRCWNWTTWITRFKIHWFLQQRGSTERRRTARVESVSVAPRVEVVGFVASEGWVGQSVQWPIIGFNRG